jgi:Abnormal spindle-like microcephaly-assoc'd, ASPM-SPD-2-Hydin
MKSRTLVCIAAITLFVALAIRVRLVAQEEQPAPPDDAVVNLDILGEPNSSTEEGDRLLSESAALIETFVETPTTAATSAPNASLSPTSLTFSSQAIGTVSAAKIVTLKNTGTTRLTITSIAIAGANSLNFIQTHTCLTSLAAGASCTISVKFKPNATGTRRAALNIYDNATGSPQRVALSGTGGAPSCTPIGVTCGPTLPRCCAAPFPHHSICTSQTGFGVCVMT